VNPRHALLLCLALSGCTERAPTPSAEAEREAAPACEAPAARRVVEQLGERLKDVPLLAPDSLAVRAIREAYAPLVTADLLEAWTAEPSRAPGRDVSSPWPERIAVRSVAPAERGACRVEGDVVYVTSEERAQGGAATREPVTLEVVREGDEWRIGAYEPGGPRGIGTPPAEAPSLADSAGAQEAAAVVRRYYEAIGARDFRRAYGLWGDGGAASGQTFEAFEAGFAETAHGEAEVGEPGRVEGAAGSRYVEVPVALRAVTTAGEEQRFEGTYTLRRAVADGATAEQRRWHLYTADVARVR